MLPRTITSNILFYGDNGVEVKMPPAHGTFKTAARVQADLQADQFPLDFLD